MYGSILLVCVQFNVQWHVHAVPGVGMPTRECSSSVKLDPAIEAMDPCIRIMNIKQEHTVHGVDSMKLTGASHYGYYYSVLLRTLGLDMIMTFKVPVDHVVALDCLGA